MKKIIDRKLFTQPVMPPENRYTLMSVTVYSDGKFNMNGKLSEKLGGKRLRISFTADAKNFILAEAPDNNIAIAFPKNGSKIIPSALELLRTGKYRYLQNMRCGLQMTVFGRGIMLKTLLHRLQASTTVQRNIERVAGKTSERSIGFSERIDNRG